MKLRKDNETASTTRSDTRREAKMIGPGINFAVSEAYKLLRTNLLFSFSGEKKCHVVGVTSSFRSEGKSVTAINLAYSLAQTQARVLLMEGDMRLPTIARRLGLAGTPGLSNLLAGMSEAQGCIQTYTAQVDDKEISVDVLTSGDTPPNPSELLGSERMLQLLEQLRKHYDHIIVDLPPVIAVSDPIVACKIVDGMIVIVRAERSARDAVAETIRQLKQVEAHILGFVFNGAGDSGGGYYRGKRYYRKNYYRRYYKSYQDYQKK